MIKLLTFILFFTVLFANSEKTVDDKKNITADEIRDHIKFLSSDKLKGRRPGTRGSKQAIRYIEKRMEIFWGVTGGGKGL